MDKDAPLMLFPNLDKDQNVTSSSLNSASNSIKNTTNKISKNLCDFSDEITKLQFKYPINLYFDNNHEVKCLTQKYNSNNLSIKSSLLIPWHLDEGSNTKTSN